MKLGGCRLRKALRQQKMRRSGGRTGEHRPQDIAVGAHCQICHCLAIAQKRGAVAVICRSHQFSAGVLALDRK
jgi:hypothetical protein